MKENFLRRGFFAATKLGLRRAAVTTTPSIHDDEAIFAPAGGVRLAVVKDVPLLFVPGREGLFLADSIVAGLWPSLEAGMTAAAFHAAAQAAGRDGPALAVALRAAGALDLLGTADGPAAIQSRRVIDIGSLCLGVNFSHVADAEPLIQMIAPLDAPRRVCDRNLIVLRDGDRIGFALHGHDAEWYPLAQAAPGFKVALTDAALAALKGIALHVAMLSRGDEAMLLVGEPGAGKSTLSVALAAAGFRLDGDDVAALLPDGRVMGLPFPCTVKAGSWPMVAAFRPDLANRPVHLRPDGQTVRYLPLEAGAPPPRRVRTVLCLARTANASARLTPLDVQPAIAALLAEAWSASKTLATQDFDALTACVQGASFQRMTYATLDQAVALASDAWEGLHAPTTL